MDTWYSNLKTIRDHGWSWVTALRKNCIVNHNVPIEMLAIPDKRLSVHLRGYGWVTVFKFVAKKGRINYVTTNMENPTHEDVGKIIKARQSIEIYYQELKQTCGIERCQARTGRAQRNHICLSILAWLDKYGRKFFEEISFYQQDWNVIKNAISKEIQFIMTAA